MNFGTLIGFIIAISVFVISLVLSFTNINVVFDLHAALIVGGGTLAVALICFPLGQLVTLVKIFLRRILGRSKIDYMDIIRQIVMLAEARRRGSKAFEAAIETVSDPFLRDAANVLFWVQADVSAEELRDLLETRAATHFKLYIAESKVFRTLSKFPPAFGLMGTTMGMIALLQSLGGANAKDIIGPSMAIALVATLYGLVLTNFFFIPIAENLSKQTYEDMTCRSIVVEGIMLVEANKPPKYIEEKVKSFLLPSQRGESLPRRVAAQA